MLIKDNDAYLWRKEHRGQVEDQLKSFLKRTLVRSNSQKSYAAKLTALSNLCGWQKKLPNEILSRFKGKKKLDPYKFLNDFVAYLIETKQSPNTTCDYVSGAKIWLNSNSILVINELFRMKVTVPKKRKITHDATPKPEEMRLIVEHSDLRGKTLVTMTVSSGMRIGELLNLRIEDVDFNLHPTSIHIWNCTTKTDEERWTFISDEATEFLKLYLKGRAKGFIFLGRHQGIRPDGTTFLRGEIAEDEHMSYFTADTIFTTALQRAGLRRKDVNGRDVFHLHKLRYFFKTYMGPHMDSQYVEAFLGHGSGSMKHLYDDLPISELGKIYEKGMHAVTILNRTDILQVKQLQDKLQASEKTILGLANDNSKVPELEHRLRQSDEKMARMEANQTKFMESVLTALAQGNTEVKTMIDYNAKYKETASPKVKSVQYRKIQQLIEANKAKPLIEI